MVDFSSSYLEGRRLAYARYGHSRDKRPDKLQINFGISTGINEIPTALTIQKGNVQDKKHMQEIFRLVSAILEEGSLLIFDTGANTKENKQRIRKEKLHFLTLRAKRVESYRQYLTFFKQRNTDVVTIVVNDRHYLCVKKPQEDDGSVSYIYFSPELYHELMKIKEEKFERKKQQGNKLLKKRKHPVLPSDAGWVQLIPCLQRTLQDIENPYINGLEGFFIL